jgi:cob(I)alamin adenosyltransferase
LRERFPEVRVEQYGTGRFVKGKPSDEEMALAQKGLGALREALRGGRYDVVIADEACTAVGAGLFPEEELLSLMSDKPETVELVLTGRGAGARVRERADLVTEMRCDKHYYDAGVKGRVGIES